jgi:hypothetical protein
MLYLLAKATAFLVMVRSAKNFHDRVPRINSTISTCGAADMSPREWEKARQQNIRTGDALDRWENLAEKTMPGRFRRVAKSVTAMAADKIRSRAIQKQYEAEDAVPTMTRVESYQNEYRGDYIPMEKDERELLGLINEWQSLYQAGEQAAAEDKRKAIQNKLLEIKKRFSRSGYDSCRLLLTPKLMNSIPVIARSRDEFSDHVDLTVAESEESDDKQLTLPTSDALGEHPMLPEELHSRKSSIETSGTWRWYEFPDQPIF